MGGGGGMDVMQLRRAIIAAGKKSLLPPGYQQVEWIGSTGTQCIDTGYVPSMNTNIILTKGSTPNASHFTFIFGAGNDSPNQFGLNGYFMNYFGKFNQAIQNNKQQDACTIKILHGIVYIDDVEYLDLSDATGPNQPMMSIMLFCREGRNGYERFITMNLYGFEMYEGTTPVRKMIPCYRKSDSEIGMYDTVSGTFYTNSGTDTFTKGNDVN